MARQFSAGRMRGAVVAMMLAGMGFGTFFGSFACAQDSPPPPPMQSSRPPMEGAFHGHGPDGRMGGRWWDNPEMARNLNLQADQIQKMDGIFQQNRPKLIDLHASVQKEEAALEPLLGADAPDETKVLAQIDKVAQARAELEKSNARMLLEIRQVLTTDQWTKLKAVRAERMSRGGRGPGGPGNGPPPE